MLEEFLRKVKTISNGAYTLTLNTGLKDCNGNQDLYDGDILRFVDGKTGTYVCLELRYEDGSFIVGRRFKLNKGECVGNIYENRDLLGASV
jgi:hypothetical protein